MSANAELIISSAINQYFQARKSQNFLAKTLVWMGNLAYESASLLSVLNNETKVFCTLP